MANGLIYERLGKGELRTPQGKKVGSFTTNTLPRQVGKPKKRKGQKTSIPQSTYAKGMKRVKDEVKSLDKDVHSAYTRHPYIGYSDTESKKKKSKSLKKFIKADKRFRVK